VLTNYPLPTLHSVFGSKIEPFGLGEPKRLDGLKLRLTESSDSNDSHIKKVQFFMLYKIVSSICVFVYPTCSWNVLLSFGAKWGVLSFLGCLMGSAMWKKFLSTVTTIGF